MKNYFVDLDTQALYSKNQKTLEKTGGCAFKYTYMQ